MAVTRLSVAIAAAALVSAAAGVAHAADGSSRRIDYNVRVEPAAAAPHSGSVVRWDASKGRWGVSVNLQQPMGRPSTMNDVQAGAYYSITPSLKVGGSVALGDSQAATRLTAPASARPADTPKVRLETRFRF